MAAKNNTNENKIRIKPKGGKDADAIYVHPIDAKEILAGGTHECVGEAPKGKADWLPDEEPEAPQDETEPSTEDNSGESDDETDDEDVIGEDEINGMNTKELVKFVEDEELEIEGFADMNLTEKRKAVIDALDDDGEL